jgi:hypothetical protein
MFECVSAGASPILIGNFLINIQFTEFPPSMLMESCVQKTFLVLRFYIKAQEREKPAEGRNRAKTRGNHSFPPG